MFFLDKRILYIFLGICVFSVIMGYMSNANALLDMLMCIPGVLIAITFHEYAHAFSAYKLGDDTSKKQGRLTLNPLKHIDPIGIFMLLFIGIGWGKPVMVDGSNLKKNMPYRKAEAIVSFAGPLANFIMAIIFTIIYALMIKFNVFANMSYRYTTVIISMIVYTIVINIGLGVFNLIPLPPLDGSKILKAFLPYNACRWLEDNERVFYLIFLGLWITGIAGTIIAPIRNSLYSGIINLVSNIFGI